MTSPIRAVLFDLDDTLLDRTRSLPQFVRSQYSRFYDHLSHIPEAHFVQRFIALDARGSVWKDRVYQQLVVDERIVGIGWQCLLDDYVANFAASCIGFPNLHETLRLLHAQGLLLGIITNGRSPFQERNIAGLGIRPYLDVILVSDAEGVRKPEAEIFLRAASRLGVEPGAVVFVGDNPQADVAGAQQCGMRSIWFTARAMGECPFADGVCGTLDEVADMIIVWRTQG